MALTLSELEEAVKNSWAKETSSDPGNWSEGHPAWGQCAVTALVVNDYVGGEIVWAEAKIPDGRSISHYFNRKDETEIDLTRSQFPQGTVIPEGVEKKKQYASTREYVLSFPATQQRYRILKQKVEGNLNNP